MTRNTGNKECCGADATFQFFRSKQHDLRSSILARVPIERGVKSVRLCWDS
jgi:hypothetical protein